MDYLLWECFYHTGRIDMYLLFKKYRSKHGKMCPMDSRPGNAIQGKSTWEELLL